MDNHEEKPQDGTLIFGGSPTKKETAPSNEDGKAEEAAEVVDEILHLMDLDADVEIREDDERIVLDVDGPDAGRAIGKKCDTRCDSVLVNKIINRFAGCASPHRRRFRRLPRSARS
ncbi:MAG: hypothetical protein R3A47_08870 [Polyangiales bacterium]